MKHHRVLNVFIMADHYLNRCGILVQAAIHYEHVYYRARVHPQRLLQSRRGWGRSLTNMLELSNPKSYLLKLPVLLEWGNPSPWLQPKDWQKIYANVCPKDVRQGCDSKPTKRATMNILIHVIIIVPLINKYNLTRKCRNRMHTAVVSPSSNDDRFTLI